MSDPTPAELEATGATTVDVEYGGNTYTFPLLASVEDLDGDVFDAMEAGQQGKALQALIGPVQWSRFKATKPKVRDYRALAEAWESHLGFALGE